MCQKVSRSRMFENCLKADEISMFLEFAVSEWGFMGVVRRGQIPLVIEKTLIKNEIRN